MKVDMEEINVIVVDRGRKYLYLRYTDPVTGQKVEKSARTTKKKEAVKRAGEWQSELLSGVTTKQVAVKWDVFQEQYEDHVAATLAKGTYDKVAGMFNLIEQVMKPDSLHRISAQWVSRFQKELLKTRQQSTVESHCRHLKAALNWAKTQGMIAKVPHFNKLKKARRQKVMKGRGVTEAEFKQLLEAVELLPSKQHASVDFLLRGLWLSGLRLGEAMGLTWDQWGGGIRVDVSGAYTKLLIPAEAEKGGKDRVYPVTPDFAAFLDDVPKAERIGNVFKVVSRRGITSRRDTTSKIIVGLGREAGVQVDQKGKDPIYASAHDLRRAFGQRWAKRVMPLVLKELMRHNSVTTTEKYYVNIDADNTAAFLAGLGDT